MIRSHTAYSKQCYDGKKHKTTNKTLLSSLLSFHMCIVLLHIIRFYSSNRLLHRHWLLPPLKLKKFPKLYIYILYYTIKSFTFGNNFLNFLWKQAIYKLDEPFYW